MTNVAESLPSLGEHQARMVAAVLDVLPETSNICFYSLPQTHFCEGTTTFVEHNLYLDGIIPGRPATCVFAR